MRRDGIEAVGASTPVGADQIVDSFCTNNEVADIYTLQVGKDGEERLNILNELYNSLTEKFLEIVMDGTTDDLLTYLRLVPLLQTLEMD